MSCATPYLFLTKSRKLVKMHTDHSNADNRYGPKTAYLIVDNLSNLSLREMSDIEIGIWNDKTLLKREEKIRVEAKKKKLVASSK